MVGRRRLGEGLTISIHERRSVNFLLREDILHKLTLRTFRFVVRYIQDEFLLAKSTNYLLATLQVEFNNLKRCVLFSVHSKNVMKITLIRGILVYSVKFYHVVKRPNWVARHANSSKFA